jgi:hypothetical protein
MILIVEDDLKFPGKKAFRIVPEDGDIGTVSLLDVRAALRKAVDDLPGRSDQLFVCDPKKRRASDAK